MERPIVGYHLDDAGDWVAELGCGHQQHVRHRPPFQIREWILDERTRNARLGTPLDCRLCDQPSPVTPPPGVAAGLFSTLTRPPADEGGDPACWAGLLCPECGAVLGGAHRDPCPAPGAPAS